MPAGHSQFNAERVMIMAAPNGARRTKADHPALPLTAGELAACAARLAELGVSVLHLHVRDRQGRHTLDADAYRTAMRSIGDRTGDALIVQVTTEAVGRYSAGEQMAVVRELRPEAVSLALRELCPDAASEAPAAEFFGWLVAEHIWPQYILHSIDDLRRFETMRRRGVFADDHPACLLVLGRYGDEQQGEPRHPDKDLDTLLPSVAPGVAWSVCCFGAREDEAARKAYEKGGHVRLGFENNLLLADGRRASDNAALIAQFTTAIEGARRPAATADEVREEFIGGRI